MKFNFDSKPRKSIYEMEKWTDEEWKDLEDFLLPIIKQICPRKEEENYE